MAHAHKGGISHSPGQRFAAPKQRYAPPRRRFALGRTKAITPNRPRRTAIPRQKTPIGGLAAWAQYGIRGPIGGFSVAFGASPLLFELFLRLRDASRGPIVAFSASQGRKRCSGAPWRRFLPRICCLARFSQRSEPLSLLPPSSLRNFEKPAKVSFPRLDGYY